MSAYGNALIPVNANFAELDDIFMDLGINKVNGALFDLGVSSFQIDTAERGFSFTADGPLDMRLDRTQQLDAYYAVNKLSRDQLAEIIKEYGEERYAKTVAAAIVKARKEKSITTTLRLAEIIKRAIGNKYFKQRLHPAARTFQGIRIYVNNELNSLKTALNGIIRHLEPKARLCVISFHSLEDRIVKNIFRDKSREKEIIIHTKKPLIPEREEIKNNYRARSAKMRVSEKT
jgi:16S rRNA (cytosine1402-N4)-methyltransferase